VSPIRPAAWIRNLSGFLAGTGLLVRNAVASSAFEGPKLVLGDFNTPGDSVWFVGLRRNYSEVLETAGSGLLATWPFPVPLLGLDHIWVSSGLVPRCAGKRSGWRSDHALVWSMLSFASNIAHPPSVAKGPVPVQPASR
jgi:endonuclease/exonuclease/phosphatase family metal-dependent hydrolase